MKRLMIFLTGGLLLSWIFAVAAMADVKPVGEPEEVQQAQPVLSSGQTSGTPAPPVQSASPQAFQLNWLSINGGGAINASSASYQLGLSVGQSVAGYATSSSYQMGIGFWYGAPTGGPICLAAKGDLNGLGGLTASDAVLMLNCVFLGNGSGTVGGDCNLCYSDVNCDINLSASDAVLELNRIFLGSTAPPWCGS